MTCAHQWQAVPYPEYDSKGKVSNVVAVQQCIKCGEIKKPIT